MNAITSPNIDQHRQFYDSYWRDRQHKLNVHEIVRLAEILGAIARVSALTSGRPLRICDLGCGRGWLSNELAKFGSVVAVDLSEVGVERARKQWPAIDFRVADITQWRPDEQFDLVVSSEVMEHVPDQKAFAETVRFLLRGGGHLILTMPNRRCKSAWDKGDQKQQPVEQWLTPRELRALLHRFQPILQRTFFFDFCYSGFFRVASAPKLIKAFDALRIKPLYDAIRDMSGLGLYQLYVGSYVR